MSNQFPRLIHLSCTPDYKVGDPQPDGYIDRQEWAAVQMKAGLKQEQCGWCSRWKFPFEMSDHVESMKCMTSKGKPHVLTWKLCLPCRDKQLARATTPAAPQPTNEKR